MPTGYTAAIAEGKTPITLRQYALTCARAFGALVTMCDDPFDAPVPTELTPDTRYHYDQLAKAETRFAELLAMSPHERDSAAAQYNRDKAVADQQRADRNAAQRQRYDDMISAVEAWPAWPGDGQGLKDFMLEQLVESRRFDTNDLAELAVAPLTTDEWFESELTKARWSAGYHAKAYNEEIERTASRNAWLKALWASLPTEEAAK